MDDGDACEADRLARDAVAMTVAREAGDATLMAPAIPVAGLVAARSGQVEEASQYLEQAREALARPTYMPPPSSLLTHVVLAETALMTGHVEQAREHVAQAVTARTSCPTAVETGEHLDGLVERLRSGHRELAHADPLTTSELRVLWHLPTHFSVQQIARDLMLSPNTVKSHCQAIYRKLQVHTRGEAVSEARRLGIIGTEARMT